MKKKLLLFLFFGFLFSKVHSQKAIVVAGGSASGAEGTVSYTVGQIAYKYLDTSSGSENQGTQQPFEIATLGMDNFPTILLEMSVYPNPTTNNVVLKIMDLLTKKMSYQLFDNAGKQIKNEIISNSETTIVMDNLNASVYLLSVIENNNVIKSFKIIKK